MSNSTPPEPIMFWFFLVFGIIGFLFCFGGFLLAYYRRIATACTVSDGRIVWAQETGLPKRFDHKGEIEIASIHSINVEYWHDGSVRGFKFDMGDDTKMIEASLGPALCGQWSDDFLDAVLFWNPEISSGVTKRAEQGADAKPDNVAS